MSTKLSEDIIDFGLQQSVKGAEAGDAHRARYLHEIIAWMLTESEGPDGRYWLTPYGRELIFQMHDKLSKCPESGKELTAHALKAVMLTPAVGDIRHLGHVIRDFDIANAVADEITRNKNRGTPVSVTQACKNLAASGKFDLKWGTIRNTFYRVRSFVSGELVAT